MQLHLEGSRTIHLKRARAFGLLTDPNFIARSLPDASEVIVLDRDSLEAKVKVKLSIVSGTLNMRLRISDRSAPSRARLTAEGSGTGSGVRVNSTFELEGDGSTTMKWSAEAEITGLMAGLGSTLLRGFAEKKVGEIFDGITRALEAEGA